MAVPADIRRNLEMRCRSKRTRTSVFSEVAPTKWQPRSVRNPARPGENFTDDSAWEFVAFSLAKGAEVMPIRLAQASSA